MRNGDGEVLFRELPGVLLFWIGELGQIGLCDAREMEIRLSGHFEVEINVCM